MATGHPGGVDSQAVNTAMDRLRTIIEPAPSTMQLGNNQTLLASLQTQFGELHSAYEAQARQ
eukprot:6463760-Pyramimonas_sp.AAC.1